MTEAKLPGLETHEHASLGAVLGPLGLAIEENTRGHDDVHLGGSFSRRFDLDEKTKIALIFKKEGREGIGPDIIIQKEAIEMIDGEEVLRSYVLRWPKDFPESEENQKLTVISPAAKKDKRREIKGADLKNYSKDLEAAFELIRQAKQALGYTEEASIE
jgi:hypothetical protein